MIEKFKREAMFDLPLGFRLPEVARTAQPEHEEAVTLWDRVIRMCDRYGLQAARALSGLNQ
jgi:hypothetical protein